MGSLFVAALYKTNEKHAQAAWDAIEERLRAIDACLSDWRDDSEVARLRATPKGESFVASPRLAKLLLRTLEFAAATDSAFDPTIGPLTRLWRQSRANGRLPDHQTLARARARVGVDRMRFDPQTREIVPLVDGLSLDFGGVGKGLALAEARTELRARGLPHFLLSFGGDVLIGDFSRGSGIGTIPCTVLPNGETACKSNTAYMASGDAEQYVLIDGTRYSHILDPRTGLGVTSTGDAVVRHWDPVLADFLATTLCVIGERREMQHLIHTHEVEAIVRHGTTEVVRRWTRRLK